MTLVLATRAPAPAAGRTFTCDVGVALFTPPALQGRPFRNLIRTPDHDRFGLAVRRTARPLASVGLLVVSLVACSPSSTDSSLAFFLALAALAFLVWPRPAGGRSESRYDWAVGHRPGM